MAYDSMSSWISPNSCGQIQQQTPVPPPDLSSCSIHDICLYLYKTPYGEESMEWLSSLETVTATRQQQHGYESFPWNVQWRIWCRRRVALEEEQGRFAAKKEQLEHYNKNNDDVMSTSPSHSTKGLPALEPLMAQLQACVLASRRQVEQNDTDEDDLLPILHQPYGGVEDDLAWQHDSLLQDWNKHGGITHYHVLQDLQRCSLSREQQRDVQYILASIDELATRNDAGNSSGGCYRLSWDTEIWGDKLEQDGGEQLCTKPMLPRLGATLDELMQQRPQHKSTAPRDTKPLVAVTISPKFRAYVKSKMIYSTSGRNSRSVDLLAIVDVIGEAPRSRKAISILEQIRSLSTRRERQALLDRVVQQHQKEKDGANSTLTSSKRRRGFAWVVAGLVDSVPSTAADMGVDKTNVPFDPVPPTLLYYDSREIAQETSILMCATRNYLERAKLANMCQVVSALWDRLTRNIDTGDDVLSVVRDYRDWLPASTSLLQQYRCLWSRCLSGNPGWERQKEVMPHLTAFVSQLLGSLEDWSFVYDHQFCQYVLLPLRHRFCLALLGAHRQGKFATCQSGLLASILKRLLLENVSDRQVILEACPHLIWLLCLFAELPVAGLARADKGCNRSAFWQQEIVQQMKKLYEVSRVVIGSGAGTFCRIESADRSIWILPHANEYVESVIVSSKWINDEGVEHIDAWSRHVSHVELARYGDDEMIRIQWLESLVNTKSLSSAIQPLHQQVCRRYWGSVKDWMGASKATTSLAERLLEKFAALHDTTGSSLQGEASLGYTSSLLQVVCCTPAECLLAQCPTEKTESVVEGLLALYLGVEASCVILVAVVLMLFEQQIFDLVCRRCHRVIYNFLRPSRPDQITSWRSCVFARLSREVEQKLVEHDCMEGSNWWRQLCVDVERSEFPLLVMDRDEASLASFDEPTLQEQAIMDATDTRSSATPPSRKRRPTHAAVQKEPKRRFRASVDSVIQQVWGERLLPNAKLAESDAERTSLNDREQSDANVLKEGAVQASMSDGEDYDEDDDAVLLV